MGAQPGQPGDYAQRRDTTTAPPRQQPGAIRIGGPSWWKRRVTKP